VLTASAAIFPKGKRQGKTDFFSGARSVGQCSVASEYAVEPRGRAGNFFGDGG
jgi:hypothetical protein